MTEERLWLVVGGSATGGLVVRTGKEFTSAEESERLSTGAIVREEELVGNRLRYRRTSGSGPDTGWVSISVKEKALVVRTSKASAGGAEPAAAEAGPRARELVALGAQPSSAVSAPKPTTRTLTNSKLEKRPLQRAREAATKVPQCFRVQGDGFVEPRQLVRLKRVLAALDKPVKAALAVRFQIEGGGSTFERMAETQEDVTRALALVHSAAEELDPPLVVPERARTRCATPGCSYLVHSRDTLAGYCCGACWKAAEDARERERANAMGTGGLWHKTNSAPFRPGMRSMGGGLPGLQVPLPMLRPGGHQLAPGPKLQPGRFSQGMQLAQPARTPAPVVATSHDWRCERKTALASADRASRTPKPADNEELAEMELEEALRLSKVYSGVKRPLKLGPDNTWLEADPSWARGGSSAIGKWVSSIAQDDVGNVDSNGPKQMLEGGMWISKKGRVANQWIVFDLGGVRLLSEVLTRGSHASTRFNPKAMKWQVGMGSGIDPPAVWDDVVSFTGHQDNNWVTAAITPPRKGRWWRLYIISNWGDSDYVWLVGLALRQVWKEDWEKTEEEKREEEEEKRDEEQRKEKDKKSKDEGNKKWTNDVLRRDDEKWQPPTGCQKLLIHALLQDKVLYFQDKPYIDRRWHAASEFAASFLQQPAEEGWTLDYDPDFFCELAYEGFNPITLEIPLDGDYMIQVLSPCFEPARNTVDCLETHVSKRVQKCAHQYTMTLDTAYDDVILGCICHHGEAWLYRGQRWLHRRLFKEGYKGKKDIRMNMHSIELWDSDGVLVAGDLGYTIGGLYVSQTGFRREGTKGAGEVQLVLTAALLHKMGHNWFDLGQANPYKSALGARTLDRVAWLERFRLRRDATCRFSHEAIGGGELLHHLMQAQLDRTNSFEAARKLPGPWPALASPAPRVLECPAEWGPGQAWDFGSASAAQSEDLAAGDLPRRQLLLQHSDPSCESTMKYVLTLPAAGTAKVGGQFPLLLYMHSASGTIAEESTEKWLPTLMEEAALTALVERGRSGPINGFIGLTPRCSPLLAEGTAAAVKTQKERKAAKKLRGCSQQVGTNGCLVSAPAKNDQAMQGETAAPQVDGGSDPEVGAAEPYQATAKPGFSAVSEEELRFPEGFLWGASTAAYQIEGAAAEGGRSPSIWDTFCAKPGKVVNGATGEVACDHYHRWREDIKLMKEMGLPAYRFSISWSRLLPTGRGEPNPEAVSFYKGLLDELRAEGITCMVTIYHWDLPQCLEDEYKGWLGKKVVSDFEHFAVTCFKTFGDGVSLWITLNEPWCSAVLGYANGEMAPGRKERPEEEPYLAAHHMLLAHARAVRRYREDFQATQGGQIGISLNVAWHEPLTEGAADREAAQRALDWSCGWFADPIWKGDYPESMRRRCGERLPSFSRADKEELRGSSDFFGLNHYMTSYASAPPCKSQSSRSAAKVSPFSDQEVHATDDPRWLRTDMDWAVVPWGLRRLSEYIHRRYMPAGGIFITESGCAAREKTVAEGLRDTFRVEYLQGYIAQLHKAIQSGANVRGYFAWSFMDNFEWQHGYGKRFGLVRVDYRTQARTPKASGRMLAELARTNTLRIPARLLAASDFAKIRDCDWRGTPRAYWFKSVTEDAYNEWDFSEATRCALVERLVVGLLATVLENLPVDASRVYLLGHSLGGYAVLRLAELVPKLPAAVIPMAGYYPDITGQDHHAATLAERVQGIPRIWPLHCEFDKACRWSSQHVGRVFSRLREKCGVEVEFVSPGLARGRTSDYHAAHRYVTDDPEAFFNELLQISRSEGADAAEAAAYLRNRLSELKEPAVPAAPEGEPEEPPT